MDKRGQWYFSKEELEHTPSRKMGIDSDKELFWRQQAANYIQDLGQRLQMSQLGVNTAILYMHRFYVFHSFTHFHRFALANAAVFLAAKVEEQPRKIEHVIKVGQIVQQKYQSHTDRKPENFTDQLQELILNENIMLQTIGFDINVDHPHTYVVRACQMVCAHRELAQTAYFMASTSLHLTTMCLQYKATMVACLCMYLALKWTNYEIPLSSEGKEWYYYVDTDVTPEVLEKLTEEFLYIFDKCPSRLKKRINTLKEGGSTTPPNSSDADSRKGSSSQNHKKFSDHYASFGSRDLFFDYKRGNSSVSFPCAPYPRGGKKPTFTIHSTAPTSSVTVNGSNISTSLSLSSNISGNSSSSKHSHSTHNNTDHNTHKSAVNDINGSGSVKVKPPPATTTVVRKEVNHEHASKSGSRPIERPHDIHPRVKKEPVPTIDSRFGFPSTVSHSEIISNVVKEVAKQNEKLSMRSDKIKDEKKISLIATPIISPSTSTNHKPHSIFSPVKQTESIKDLLPQTPGKTFGVPKTRVSPKPIEKSSSKRHHSREVVNEPELSLVVPKLEKVTGFEDIVLRNSITVGAPATPTMPKLEDDIDCGIIVGNHFTTDTKKKEHHHGTSTSGSSSHHHKKKKKHKEKDKHKERRHKEKKKHKEDKHKKIHKEPSPIKITIPKEKLVDIPMKLKIKINKDQGLTSNLNELEDKLHVNKESSSTKIRKRARESIDNNQGQVVTKKHNRVG